MKIGVLLKEVPDTESLIQVASDGNSIATERLQWVINPYDEIALEEALRLKGTAGGEVVIVTAGPARAADSMRRGLAMGADRGVLIDTEGIALDPVSTALALSRVCEGERFDAIFAGKMATDDGWGQVHIGVAEMLGIPHVSPVEGCEFDIAGGGATFTRAAAGGVKEIVAVRLPAVIGCEKGLNEPRYASLPGIIKSKSKTIDSRSARDLVDAAAPLYVQRGLAEPAERESVRMIAGSPSEAAQELVRLLREEARVI